MQFLSQFEKTSKYIYKVEREEQNKNFTPDESDMQNEIPEGFLENYYNEQEALEKIEYDELTDLFVEEYYSKNKNNEFFYGCLHSIYDEKYNERLTEFLNNYTDAEEFDFIVNELNVIANTPIPNSILNFEVIKNINYSIQKTTRYLITKLENLKFNVEYLKETNSYSINPIKRNYKGFDIINTIQLKWKGDDTELIEIAKGLFESGLVESKTQKEFFTLFCKLFNKPNINHSKALQNIQSRTKDLAISIPKLDLALKNWIKRNDGI